MSVAMMTASPTAPPAKITYDASSSSKEEEQRKRNLDNVVAYQKRHPDRAKASRQKYFQKNKAGRYAYRKEWTDRNIERYMFFAARKRAKKRGLEFALEVTDIVVPELCPVLGIKLARGSRHDKSHSPSLDRLDSAKGYIKGNVRVISNRANGLKSDASIDELLRVVEYMKGLR